MPALRILLCTRLFLPHFARGTEILTYKVAKTLQARGHAVRVLTGHDRGSGVVTAGQPHFEHDEYDGLPVLRVHYRDLPAGSSGNVMAQDYHNPEVSAYLQQSWSDWKPDLVHALHLRRLSAELPSLCAAQHIPFIFTATDFWWQCPMGSLLLPEGEDCSGPSAEASNCFQHLVQVTQAQPVRWLTRQLPRRWLEPGLRWNAQQPSHWGPLPLQQARALSQRWPQLQQQLSQAQAILAPTRLMHTQMLAAGLPPERVHYSPFGIWEDQTPPPPGRPVGTVLRLGFIGSMLPHKGPDVLLQALQHLSAHAPLQLILYGNPDEDPAYGARLRALAGTDPRVHFAGTFPNAEIDQVLRGLDLLAIPSRWHENSPLVLHSAQAQRTPVLASNKGGLSDQVQDRQQGRLLPAGDVAAWASAISEILAQPEQIQAWQQAIRPPRSLNDYVDELEMHYAQARGRA